MHRESGVTAALLALALIVSAPVPGAAPDGDPPPAPVAAHTSTGQAATSAPPSGVAATSLSLRGLPLGDVLEDRARQPQTEPRVLPPIFDRIVHCESRGDAAADNPVSSASGLYQFIDSTWAYVWRDYLGVEPPTARAKHASVEQQTRAAVALYQAEGLTPWAASRGCWG